MYNLNLFISTFLLPIILGCTSTLYQISLSRQIINNFSNKIEKNEGLSLIGLGYGGSQSGKLTAFMLRFKTIKHMNVDQSRNLFIGMCEDLLAQINSNEKMEPWLDNYPYTGKNVDIILSFWEHEGIRVHPPNVALVDITNGIVRYSIYENEKFVDVLEETYEQAVEIYKKSHF